MSNRLSTAVVKGPIDDDGKWNVIACGYGENNKYGYFICKESRTETGDIIYTDITEFYVKEDEKTFQQVINDFKNRFPPD